VIINGVAQNPPADGIPAARPGGEFLDEFPLVPPTIDSGATEAWSVDFPSHIENGDLVVPPITTS